MTAVASYLPYILIIAVLFATLILFALHKKDHVRAIVRLRSFGFLLEANNGIRGRRPTRSSLPEPKK